jgi:hypothetical protein
MKKAAVAVAHRILAMAWKIIREGVEYQEYGRDAFDRRHPLRTVRKLTKRLEQIGFLVQVTPRPAPSLPQPEIVVTREVCKQCATWKLSECIHVNKHRRKPESESNPA